jgi:6-phosphogluconolactonase (cycloisomerase 2 family)
VVTEKATSTIDTYIVGPDGLASDPISHPSSGATPFGFDFGKRGELIVSEAFGAVSSYLAVPDGSLPVITASAPTHQAAPCWIVVTQNGQFAYTTNAGSGAISGYCIAPDGSLQLLHADGITAITGSGTTPVDMAQSINSRYLYVLLRGSGAIGAFQVQADGRLSFLGAAGTLPASVTGLAAR